MGPNGWNRSKTITDATQQGPAAALDTADPACLSTGPLGFTPYLQGARLGPLPYIIFYL